MNKIEITEIVYYEGSSFDWYLEFEGKTRIISLYAVSDYDKIYQEVIDSQNYSFKCPYTERYACWLDTGWCNTFEEALDDINDSPKLKEKKYTDIINPLVKKHHLETTGQPLEDMFWELGEPDCIEDYEYSTFFDKEFWIKLFSPYKS